ncbi:hypothetical protein F4555_000841 [Mobiluncus mulieris]|nr:hypothetical protein [Mobiluncus mulieris]MBB5846045.1 hypothetical protein [Mobiluncus mulieris]
MAGLRIAGDSLTRNRGMRSGKMPEMQMAPHEPERTNSQVKPT